MGPLYPWRGVQSPHQSQLSGNLFFWIIGRMDYEQVLPAGLIIPTLTPLTPEGEIDEFATRCLIEYLIEGGADALFLLGSTGEGDSLSLKNQYRYVELVA